MRTASFPLRYAHGNILIGQDGSAAALYRLALVSYRFLPASAKWMLQRRLERLASVIAADFSLWRVTRSYPASRYADELEATGNGETGGEWRSLIAAHRQRLAGLGCHEPEVYLAVSLEAERAPSGIGAGIIRVSDRLSIRIRRALPLGGTSAIPAERIDRLSEAEHRAMERLSGLVSLRRASTLELQWLIRRAAARGIAEPELDIHWKPQALQIAAGDAAWAYEPLEQVLWRCANAAVSERRRELVIDGEAGRSHQAMLAVGALPDAPLFPGAAAELLFAPLEDGGFPVDAVLHARWVANRQALGEVRKRIADVEHGYSEQAAGSAHGPGILAGQDRVLAREYEAQLQAGSRPAMLYASISLALGAADEAELERRVAVLRERYGDLLLHLPAGLQYALWLDHLPRPAGGVVDYLQQVTTEQFGAMVATATHMVGSREGVYLGYTPNGVPRPVRYDVRAPSREARASTVLLAGTLGSGKTIAAQLITHAAALSGSRVIDIDPKPDHGFERAPGLQGKVELLELSGDESQQGRLDPLLIGIEDMREELACSYLVELLRDPPAAWENAIGRAVRDVVHAGGRSSMLVVESLKARDSEPAREAGEALEVLCNLGLARLGFAAPSSAGLREAAGLIPQVLSIRTPGLCLPDPAAARETYTRAERISAATLSLLAAYVLRLISTDRRTHKVVLLDEAHSFLANRQGRAVVERLVRMGRACNATVLLSTQLIGDLGSLIDLIGTWLIFGQEADSQASRALALLGLDGGDEQLVAQLRGYEKGRCLMRDLHGRVGELQVDAVDPRLLAAFDTTPGANT